MTAIAFNTAPRFAIGAAKSQTLFSKLLAALDAYAMYRAQKAVPEHELRRTEREINRYCQLMREAAASKNNIPQSTQAR